MTDILTDFRDTHGRHQPIPSITHSSLRPRYASSWSATSITLGTDNTLQFQHSWLETQVIRLLESQADCRRVICQTKKFEFQTAEGSFERFFDFAYFSTSGEQILGMVRADENSAIQREELHMIGQNYALPFDRLVMITEADFDKISMENARLFFAVIDECDPRIDGAVDEYLQFMTGPETIGAICSSVKIDGFYRGILRAIYDQRLEQIGHAHLGLSATVQPFECEII